MKFTKTYLLVFAVLLIISGESAAQRLLKLTVDIDGRREYLSYVSRNGMSYVSSKELTLLLGGSFFYNSEAAKVEMKFENYRLKVTARNQFFVLINRSDDTNEIIQIPLSTLFVKDDVFIPILYSLDLISKAFGSELLFNEDDKNLSVTGKPVSEEFIAESETPAPPTPPIAEIKKTHVNSAYDIYDLQIDEMTNGTLVRLKTQKPIHRFSSSIQDGKLRLFISGASVDPKITSRIKTAGFIRKAELKNVKGNYQLEFLLKDGYSTHESTKDIESDDIIISIHNKVFSTFEENLSKEVSEWKFDVIVIDAGHGGKDPGAIGVSKVREKDVNLKVALKLGEVIKKNMPDVKVVYTRDNDTFIELYKRGKIANEANGKLFISIHCNSLAKKNSGTRGFEVYLLRPGKTKRAIEIAEFENSVINYEEDPQRYQQLTDENFILVTMAHSAYMRYSEKFSDLLNKNWSKKATGIPSRGIKQAGFYVLVGASMPGVLIETGFLSNSKDEKYLNSTRGQTDIANAVFESIKEYRQYYNEQLEQEAN